MTYYSSIETDTLTTYFEVPKALHGLLASDGWGVGVRVRKGDRSRHGITYASPYDDREIEAHCAGEGINYEIVGTEFIRDLILSKRPTMSEAAKDKEFVSMVFDDACADALFNLFHG